MNPQDGNSVLNAELMTPIPDDVLALIVIATLLGLAVLELKKPYLQPGLRTIKDSYLTNVTLFLFNDITLSLLSIPALFLAAQHRWPLPIARNAMPLAFL